MRATTVNKTATRARESLPETLRQAKRWDNVKGQATTFGCCERCAAQYAWGIQIGFTHSHPPCTPCADIIADHNGRPRPNGWRTLHEVDTDRWPA